MVWPQDDVLAIAALAGAHDLPCHLDGARLWNAHVATDIPLHALAAPFQTVSVALSKGLGCPMGSLLCGKAADIARARALQHAFGGGLRQAGIVAAAGRYALKHNLARLAEDHRRAKHLACRLRNATDARVTWGGTNMVFVQTARMRAVAIRDELSRAGILCHPNRHDELRFVTHLDIDDCALSQTVDHLTTCAQTWATA